MAVIDPAIIPAGDQQILAVMFLSDGGTTRAGYTFRILYVQRRYERLYFVQW
jgi:hypothetical protein